MLKGAYNSLVEEAAWSSSTRYLDLFSVAPSSTPRVVKIVNWSASHQLAFLIVYVPFEIFGYLFTVSPISKTVLNTFDT